MVQLLYTDLIKNRSIQWLMLLLVLLELCVMQSFKHSLLFIGIPYGISLILSYSFRSKKIKKVPRISAQYRSYQK